MPMQENLKRILKEVDSKIAFTIDAWWARNKSSYYAITAHFIDKKWKLLSTILDLISSRGRHAGVDIAELFINAIKNFEIEDKIIGNFSHHFFYIITNKSIKYNSFLFI